MRLGDAIFRRTGLIRRSTTKRSPSTSNYRFVDLINDPPDQSLLVAADADIYVRKLAIPWKRQEDGRLLIATAEPGPATLLFARERWGADIEFVVTSKFDIVWAVQTAFGDELSHRAVHKLREHDSEMSAHQVFTPAQIIIGYAAADCRP